MMADTAHKTFPRWEIQNIVSLLIPSFRYFYSFIYNFYIYRARTITIPKAISYLYYNFIFSNFQLIIKIF